jgi:multiple antibiotic resistance protein
MPQEIQAWLQFSLVAMTSIFFIVDPVATVPAFLVMTERNSPEKRRQLARQAAWTLFGVLSAFALAGTLIFKLFGITLPALKIGGGLLLFLVAIEMLEARRSGTQEVEEERREGAEKEEIGIAPLGVPMLAGPGAISTAMVLMGQSRYWWQAIPVFVAIAATAIAAYYILAAADRVRGRLGETGMRILMRLMGLVLTTIAVQFVLNGLADLGLVRLPRADA